MMYNKYLKTVVPIYVFLFITLLFSTLLSIYIPFYISKIVNENLWNLEAISKLILIILFEYFSYLLIGYLRLNITKRITLIVHQDLYKKYFNMRYYDILQLEPTYIVERINQCVSQITIYLSNTQIQIIISSLSILIITIILIANNIWICMIVLLAILINIIGHKILNAELQQKCVKLQDVSSKNFKDKLSMCKEVDTFYQLKSKSLFLKKIEELQKYTENITFSINIFANVYSTLLNFITFLFNNSIYLLCSYLLYKRVLEVGDILMILMFQDICFGKMHELNNLLISLRDLKGVNEFIDILDKSANQRLQKIQFTSINKINISNLNFSYNDKNILNNITMYINTDTTKTIGIKGESGCGKSTLLKLLAGYYKTDSIRFNNSLVSEIDQNSLNEYIGYYSQNIPIISGNLSSNISLLIGRTVSESDIKSMSFMHKFYENGKEKVFAEGGINLSGGDKQKIIACAIVLDNRPILLLDEITNSLDDVTSTQIIQTICNVRKNQITIFVSHKLSDLKDLDVLYEINNNSMKRI